MSTEKQLLPPGKYHVLIHRLIKRGDSLWLHCSVIDTGDRLALFLFKHHVTQIIMATLRQNTEEQFSGGQVEIELSIDPKYESNRVLKITKPAVLLDVASDVVVTPPSREYCEFGGL